MNPTRRTLLGGLAAAFTGLLSRISWGRTESSQDVPKEKILSRVQVVMGRNITGYPKSAVDENDKQAYEWQTGQAYMLLHVNAVTHRPTAEIRSFTKFYPLVDDPFQDLSAEQVPTLEECRKQITRMRNGWSADFQAKLELMALATEYELTKGELESVTKMMEYVRTGTAFQQQPGQEEKLITIRSVVPGIFGPLI